jgi:hypothetical protein
MMTNIAFPRRINEKGATQKFCGVIPCFISNSFGAFTLLNKKKNQLKVKNNIQA